METIFQTDDSNFFDIPKPKTIPYELRLPTPPNEELIKRFKEYPMSFFETAFHKLPEFNSSLYGYYMAVLGKNSNVDIIMDDRSMTKQITNKRGETFYFEYYQRGFIPHPDVPTTDLYINNKKQVLKGRRLRSENDKKGYEKQKSLSFAISGSALYPLNTPNRRACNIAFLNCLIFLDFDLTFKDDLVSVFEILKADRYTKMVHRSFSGDGFVVVVEMTEKDTYNNFKLVFRKLAKHFKKEYNLTIDKACSDQGRLRYISYDPDIFIKQNTLVEITQGELNADEKLRKKAIERTAIKIAEFERIQEDNPTQFKSVSDLVDEIISSENKLVDGYENWVQIARSLHDYPIEWDRLNKWRNDQHYHTALNSANEKGSNATIRTFYYYCKQARISITQLVKNDRKTSNDLKYLFS